MGHEIKHFTYPENVNKTKVQHDLDNYAAREDWQEGCSGLNSPIRWIDHVCANYDEAEAYIESHDKGWYDQLAVKYREYEKIEPTKALLSLKDRLEKEVEKATWYAAAHSVSSFKAEFVGCPDCGSKLKRTLLKSEKCPLCRAELRGKTTVETLARYDANIRDLQKQIKEEEKKMQEKNLKKSTIKWLVKIEYHT